jgi:hypothetical protein
LGGTEPSGPIVEPLLVEPPQCTAADAMDETRRRA